MEKFTERRTAQRLFENIPVLMKILHAKQETIEDRTTLLNLGPKGAFLLSRRNLPHGTRLIIQIVTSPGGKEVGETTLTLRGRVIRAEKAVAWEQGRVLYGVAVKLDKKKFLSRPISEIGPQAHPPPIQECESSVSPDPRTRP